MQSCLEKKSAERDGGGNFLGGRGELSCTEITYILDDWGGFINLAVGRWNGAKFLNVDFYETRWWSVTRDFDIVI